jgi:hypothetical protein
MFWIMKPENLIIDGTDAKGVRMTVIGLYFPAAGVYTRTFKRHSRAASGLVNNAPLQQRMFQASTKKNIPFSISVSLEF